MRSIFILIGLLLVCAACSSKSTSSPTSAPTASSAATSGGATVKVASSPVGSILVDGSGRTLYLFLADKSTSSTCVAACATTWPPFTTVGQAQAGSGITASMLGTTHRTDGKTQVTYNGHPLYYYAADTKPGMISGQALNQFGALWYVLSPSGSSITKAISSPSPSASASTSGSGY